MMPAGAIASRHDAYTLQSDDLPGVIVPDDLDRTQSIGSISALFLDFQRYPEPCQTGPGPLPKSPARRIPSDPALSAPIEQPL